MSRIKQLLLDGRVVSVDNTRDLRELANKTQKAFDRKHVLFVYGTLKRSGGLHVHFLNEAIYLGEATGPKGVMFHLGGCPAISFEKELVPIKGELYRVNDEELFEIDRLEGHPRNYMRLSIIIPGVVQPCYTYVFPKVRAEGCQRAIPSGCWNGPQTETVPWLGFDKGYGPIAPAGTLPARIEAGKVMPLKPQLVREECVPPPGESGTWYRYVNRLTGECYGPWEAKETKFLPKVSEAVKTAIEPKEEPKGEIVPEKTEEAEEEDKYAIRYPSRTGPGVRYL